MQRKQGSKRGMRFFHLLLCVLLIVAQALPVMTGWAEDASLLPAGEGGLPPVITEGADGVALPVSITDEGPETVQSQGDGTGEPALLPGTGDPDPQPGTGDPDPQPGTGDPDPLPGTGNADPQPGTGDPDPQPGVGDPEPQPGTGDPDPQPGTGEPDPQPGTGEPDPQPGTGDPDPLPGTGDPEFLPAGDGTPVDPGFVPGFDGQGNGLIEGETILEENEGDDEGAQPWRLQALPMNVRDIMEALLIFDASIVDEFDVQFANADGESMEKPTADAQITMTIQVELPHGLSPELVADDWYDIAIPRTLVLEPMAVQVLTDEFVEFATVEALSGSTLRVRFLSAVAGLDMPTASFAVQMRFAEDAFLSGEEATLSLGEAGVSRVSFTMAEAVEENEDGEEVETSEDGEVEDVEGEKEDEETIDGEGIDEENADDEEGLTEIPEGEPAQLPEGGEDLTETGEEAVEETEPKGPGHLSEKGLVTNFAVRFFTDGELVENPTKDSKVAVTLGLTVEDSLKEEIVEGTTYTVDMPQGLLIEQPQAASVATAEGALGTAQISTENRMVLTFGQEGESLPATEGTLTFSAAFDPTVVGDVQALLLAVPDEAKSPVVPVMFALGSIDAQDIIETDNWTRVDDAPMNVRDIYSLLQIAPASIVSGMNLAFEENGQPVSGNDVTVNAAIKFSMGINIPAEVTQNLREGDTYTIDLPQEINVVGGTTSYELYGPSGGGPSYATVTVNENGRVEVKFHDAVRTLGNATGDFHFDAEFDKSLINTPGDHEIKVPSEPQDLSVTVNILSDARQGIDKQGQTDKTYNPTTITWTADFNKPMATLNNVVLSDPMPAGTTLREAHVYAIGVDVNGNVIAGSAVPMAPGAYSVGADGTITFNGPINTAVRVEYVSDITGDMTAGGDFSFTNTATLTSTETGSLSTQASVTARYGRFVEKRNIAYDAPGQTFGWEIRYNYGEKAVARADAVITDTLNGPGMVFNPDSIVVRQVTIDASGNPSLGPVVPSSQYTLSFNGNVMQVAFNQDVSGAYNIRYNTHIEGIVDDSGVSYSNSVTTKWGEHTVNTGANKPTQQQNIIKSLSHVDDINGMLTWTVRINLSKYHMVDWVMTDTMGQGLTLADESLVSITKYPGGPALIPGTDFTTDVSTDRKTLTVALAGAYKTGTSDSFELTYYTHYDTNPGATPQTVTNRVTNSWTDEYGTPHGSTSDGKYPRTKLDTDGGQKNGVYNAVTKEITWSILVNYHRLTMRPAELTDVINENQQYIHGSLRLYTYDANSGNKMGPEVSPGALGIGITDPSAANGETLKLTFPGSEDGQDMAFWIVFRTSLADKIIKQSSAYNNDAVFSANGYNTTLHGQVSVNHGGSLIDKNGTQSTDGYVHWSATINPSQSTLSTPRLVDTPSDNQRIDMDSLVIYRTSVDENGNISALTGSPLSRGVDYTATYAQNGSGTWVLSIQFTGDMTTAYVMQYRTSVYLTGMTGTVSNQIHIEGENNGQTNSGGTQQNLPVRVYSGGGTIYGKTGAVTIRKLGADNGPLAGAEIVLRDAYGNLVGRATTPANGEVTFTGIVQGTYTLYELSVPDGYTVSRQLASGLTVVVDDATTTGLRVVTVQNELTQALLRKVDALTGKVLSGAIFRVDRKNDATGSFEPYGTQTYTTGMDGVVRVQGLVPGDYQFVEISPAPGYMLNTQTVPFTLAADAQGVIPVQNMGDFQNHQGKIQLTKKNAGGQTLAGAEFTLYCADGYVVGTYVSNANGLISIDGIAPGSYILRETKAPYGYALVSDPQRIDIPDANEGALLARQLEMVNNPLEGGIIFHKIDGITGEALAGVEFALISKATMAEIARTTTDALGMGSFDEIPVGEYRLQEVAAPGGYIRNTRAWDVSVTAGDDGSIAPVDIGVLENYRGRVRVEKVNDDNPPLPLPNAEYTLYDATDRILATYLTGLDGTFLIYDLAPGTYTLRETRAPEGYMLDSSPFSITIPAEYRDELPMISIGPVINQKIQGSALFRKVDGDTRAQLAGAVFQVIRKDSGQLVTQVTTDSMGDGYVDNLTPGTYTLREIKAPDGYILNTATKDFTIAASEDGSIAPLYVGELENYQAEIKFKKVDENKLPLSGALFELFKIGGGSVGVYQSDLDGLVSIKGIEPGQYRLIEKHAPDGYALLTDPRDINIPASLAGSIGELDLGIVDNSLATGGLIFHKIDGDTGSRLAGAVFEITDLATGLAVDTVTTDADGIGRHDNLLPGNYRLSEVTPPSGYVRNTQTWDFAIVDDNGSIAPIDIGTMANYRGRIEIYKVDNNGRPLEGAVFTLYTANGVSIASYQTGSDGMARIYDLQPGTYILRETQAPDGYAVVSDQRSITIPDSNEGALNRNFIGPMVNQRALGSILFRKTDADDATGARIGGAEFSVVRVDTGAEVAYVTTDANVDTWVDNLEPGHYQLIERVAPQGYIRNTAPKDFTVELGADGSIAPKDIGDFQNGKGKVTLRKVNEHDDPLAGAEFKLFCQNDSSVVGTYTTDANGVLLIEGLIPGDYLLRETRAPDGYTLVSDPREIMIPDSVSGIMQPLKLRDMVNTPLEGGIVFHKMDGYTGTALAGATFQLVSEATGEVVAETTTDADGFAMMDDVPPGDYRLVETAAPDGYVRNTEPKLVTIQANPDGSIAPIDIGMLENCQGSMIIEKVDENDLPLAGAVFSLTTADGTVLGTFTTDMDGIASIHGLRPGTYIIREIIAPHGYALTSDPREFTIPQEADGILLPLQHGPLRNIRATGTIFFQKVDEDTGTRLSGSVFQVISKATGAEIARVVTDSTGQGYVDNLPLGDYSLVELTAPRGYILRTTSWDFTIAEEASGGYVPIDLGDFENGQGRARLRKVDDEGNPLQGAKFTLYRADGGEIGTYTTDRNGVIELYMMAPGTYTIQEIEAPAGYLLESDPIPFTIPGESGANVSVVEIGPVVNERETGVIIIRKVDAATIEPLSGALFRVINRSNGAEVARVSTDATGTAKVSGLPVGKYQVDEIMPPTGYLIDDNPVIVEITEAAHHEPVKVVMHDSRIPNWPSPTPTPRPTVHPGGPPKTGDTGNGPWIVLMALSAAVFCGAAAVLWVYSKKHKSRQDG